MTDEGDVLSVRIAPDTASRSVCAWGADCADGVPPLRGTRGHEERGARFAVIVQADEFLDLSTTLVAPTSTSARTASFRPTIVIGRRKTRVLVEQASVVDPQRLGRSAGRLEASEVRAVDDALSLILGL
jgi:mRNA interferase MazF